MKFEIKSRWHKSILFSIETENCKLALEAAVKSGADLTPIRDDFWAVLSAAPREVGGLRDVIVAGRINGSSYEGSCACLVGTIANVRKCNYQSLGSLKPSAERPSERFFLNITPGSTPENIVDDSDRIYSALESRENAALIVAMRNSLPQILRYIEKLEQMVIEDRMDKSPCTSSGGGGGAFQGISEGIQFKNIKIKEVT